MYKAKWAVVYLDNKDNIFVPELNMRDFVDSLDQAKEFYTQIIKSATCEKAFLTYVLEEYNAKSTY
ncbi:MAG: hypothetical protein Q8P20_01050 [bacterium]|nr:hypothetical protein [bacterium]